MTWILTLRRKLHHVTCRHIVQLLGAILLVDVLLCMFVNPVYRDHYDTARNLLCYMQKDLSQIKDLSCLNNPSTTTSNNDCRPLPQRFNLSDSFFPCDWESQHFACKNRLRFVPECSSEKPRFMFETVSVGGPPARVDFKDSCLDEVIRSKCYDAGFHVPRVVHYVNFGEREFPFFAFMSVLSTVRFFNACVVLVHGDSLPWGQHWTMLMQLVPQVIQVKHERPTSIFGNKVKIIQHQADIVRLLAMRHYGGVYLDNDVWLLRSMDSLRSYNGVTLGIEEDTAICNGLYLSPPNATFLDRWYEQYRTFNDDQWAEHSGKIPMRMARAGQEGVQLVSSFFVLRSIFLDCDMYKGSYPWWETHAAHLWNSYQRIPERPGIDREGSSFGEVFRHILYGSTDKCILNNCDVIATRERHGFKRK